MPLSHIALPVAVSAVMALVPLTQGVSATDASASAASAACKGARTCYVDVSVAQIWESPDKVRTVDAKALTNPVDIRGWFAAMAHDIDLRRDVPGETQTLYGGKVTVVDTMTKDGVLWDKVVVHGQPTPRDAAGYPGWVPDGQLTKLRKKAPSGTTAERVTSPTAWGYGSRQALAAGAPAKGGTEYSFNTEFAVKPVAGAPSVVEARANDGTRIYFERDDLAKVPASGVTGEDVVAEARKFLGLEYLWSGTAGFGYDCSGLTGQVYSALGITIPRDSQPQFDAGGGAAPAGSAEGERITSPADLRPGDVVGFGSSTSNVTHVGIYVGRNDQGEPMMINSPRTGERVREEPLSNRPFVGATRFIGS
ncbi:Gamma-D-glutamyl-L-lysine dipeptidyl-peptidase [Streptomyces xanthophaeus]|uniref:C40 family peptidase n=1 Tax=Streptomyces xanthophaeus TaxID=67385 RepID=UPI00233F270B|nr:C40 family peptidase [Streptomyces xanthophaeus]WCD84162.1 Gamma-D-glutamyl-L-lysine dipeptidyl-peptidase [Streptomyces xanthophaeus]